MLTIVLEILSNTIGKEKGGKGMEGKKIKLSLFKEDRIILEKRVESINKLLEPIK